MDFSRGDAGDNVDDAADRDAFAGLGSIADRRPNARP